MNNSSHLIVLKNGSKDRIYLLGSEILELNDHLQVINRVRSAFNSYYQAYGYDINFDGEDELVLYSGSEEKLAVYNADL